MAKKKHKAPAVSDADLASLGFTKKGLAFAKKIGVSRESLTDLTHIECGLHSGYPRCCVLFYVKFWWPYHAAWHAGRADLSGVAPYRQTLDALKIRAGYVPCPACALAENIVVPKPCPTTCPTIKLAEINELLADPKKRAEILGGDSM